MKKRLALLIGVLLIMTVVFTACSQPAATARVARWSEKGETRTYKISLSDFADDGKTLFKNYSQTFSQKDEDGKITEKKVTCYKDDVITSSEPTIMLNSDQVRPIDASGTYTMKIQYEATSIKLVTTQVIYSQYETELLQNLGCLDEFKNSAINVTEKEENPFTNNENRITLRSETNSAVTFANDPNQLPISSATENKGFYIGKIAQSLSEYKYETTYDFNNKKVVVKKNGGEAEERSISGNCIDASQLLLYIRSYDKSSTAFQDSPAVSVYDVTTNSVYTAAFGLNRQFNIILEDNGEQSVVAVNAVNATVGGMPFIAQYNLPDLTAVDKGYDCEPLSADKRPRYTTVKFRSGWYSFELQLDEEYKQIINAVKYQNVTE